MQVVLARACGDTPPAAATADVQDSEYCWAVTVHCFKAAVLGSCMRLLGPARHSGEWRTFHGKIHAYQGVLTEVESSLVDAVLHDLHGPALHGITWFFCLHNMFRQEPHGCGRMAAPSGDACARSDLWGACCDGTTHQIMNWCMQQMSHI